MSFSCSPSSHNIVDAAYQNQLESSSPNNLNSRAAELTIEQHEQKMKGAPENSRQGAGSTSHALLMTENDDDTYINNQ